MQNVISRSTPAMIALSWMLLATEVVGFDGRTLRIQFQKGEVLLMEVAQETEISVALGDGPVNSEMTMQQHFFLRQAVTDVAADGTATIEHRIDRIVLEMRGAPQFQFKVDTDVEANPDGIAALIAPALKTLKGKMFVSKTSPRGEILEIQLSDDLARALEKSSSSPALREAFSKDSLKEMIRQVSAVFPEGPVEKGTMWENKFEQNNAITGRNEFVTEYTYDGQESKNGVLCDRVKVRTSVAAAGGDARVKYEKFENKGILYFDAASGHPVGGNLENQTVMRVNDMFTQTLKGKTTITVKRTQMDNTANR